MIYFVKNVIILASKKGETGILIKAEDVCEAFDCKGCYRVVSGVLYKICAIFYDAGKDFRYFFKKFPAYKNKIDNIYGSINIRFEFPRGIDMETLLSRPVKSITLETIHEEFIESRIADAIENDDQGMEARLAAEKFLEERSKLARS